MAKSICKATVKPLCHPSAPFWQESRGFFISDGVVYIIIGMCAIVISDDDQLGTFFAQFFNPVEKIADTFAIALPIAQAIGRLGNYFNIEAFGTPTNLPWGLFVPISFRPKEFISFESFHPTFFYESIYLIFVSALLFFIFKKRILPNGILICLYFVLYYGWI